MSSSPETSLSAAQVTPQPARNTLAPSFEDKDIYKVVLETRNFEISLFWQRSNYFLVLNSALAVGFFNLKASEYAFVFALFGLLTSVLWLRVTLGSKYWQSRWEHRLRLIEQQVAPNLNLFAADWSTIQSDVEASVKNNRPQSPLKAWLERQVLKKQSVSYNMMLLSLCFLVGWVLLGIARLLSKG
jgi:hypothetical protein